MIEINDPNIQIGKEILEKIQLNMLKNYYGDIKKADLACEIPDNMGYFFENSAEEYIIIPICIICSGESPAWEISIVSKIIDQKIADIYHISPGTLEILSILPNEKKYKYIKLIPYHKDRNNNLKIDKMKIEIDLLYYDFISSYKKDEKNYHKISLNPFRIQITQDRITDVMKNPFCNVFFEDLNHEQQHKAFYGRNDLIEYIIKILETRDRPKIISIYSEKGLGKTALINKLKNELVNKNFVVKILSYKKSLNNLREREILNYILNQIINSVNNGDYSLKKNNEYSSDYKKTLKYYNNYIIERLRDQRYSKEIVIIFDDICILNEKINKSTLYKNHFIPFLQSIVEKNFNFSIIFTSKIDLEILAVDFPYLKDIANLSHSLEIGMFKSERENNNTSEIEGFITESLKNIQVKPRSRAIEKIIDYVGGHPFLLQCLCYELVNMMKDWKYKHPIDFWDVEQAAESLVKKGSIDAQCVEYIWEELIDDEKKAMLVLVQMINNSIYERVKLMEFGKYIRREIDANLDLIDLLSRLLLRNLIEEEEGYYRIKMKIIHQWINENLI